MIYLDNNATTKISRDVLEYQAKILLENYGNASSQYPLGMELKKILEHARESVKKAIHAEKESTLIFTSCASESNNSVFFSVINKYPQKKHIIISAVEHLSVYSTAMFWKEKGYEISVISVDQNGQLNMDEFSKSIREDTALISIMMANNETGVIFPIKQLVQIAKKISPEILFHTDAVQAVGKVVVDVTDLGVDYMSISGHKFHAPKGVGALYIRGDVPYIPFVHGGHQEGNLRAGTENIASIAAMGKAAERVQQLIDNSKKNEKLRDWMEAELSEIEGIMIIGQGAKRLPNTSNVSVKNIDGIDMLLHLARKGICVSTGSACNSVSMNSSHVLEAMGIPEGYKHSIRISLSSHSTGKEITLLVKEIKEIIKKLKEREKNNGYN